MNEQLALHTEVLKNPLDDTVRLAYADWFQEHDQPERAEFIRLQIQQCTSSFSSMRMQAIDEMYRKHYRHWFHRFGLNHTYRRGFLDEVKCASHIWLEHCDRVYWRDDCDPQLTHQPISKVVLIGDWVGFLNVGHVGVMLDVHTYTIANSGKVKGGRILEYFCEVVFPHFWPRIEFTHDPST